MVARDSQNMIGIKGLNSVSDSRNKRARSLGWIMTLVLGLSNSLVCNSCSILFSSFLVYTMCFYIKVSTRFRVIPCVYIGVPFKIRL